MRSFIKALGTILLLIAYIFTACAFVVLPAGARLRRTFLINNSAFFSRIILALLGVRVHAKHCERLRGHTRGLLIVANHVSYVDILIIASLAPSIFITSVELGSTLFLGMLARLGGSLFVERRRPSGLKKEIALISRALGEGFSVALFPEGTTSNGEKVQPFKNPLFDAAIASKAGILPVCLRYTQVNSEQMTSGIRDSVFYYGGTKFFQHVPRLLSLASVDVDVTVLKSIRIQGNVTRKELAAQAHDAVGAAYHGWS